MAKDTDNDKGPVNFTDRYLKSLKAKPGKKDHLKFDAECRGLGVRVTASGAKRFIVQWKLHGVAAVYQRYDFACERKKALEIWAAHVTGIGRDGAEVVDLAERRVRG